MVSLTWQQVNTWRLSQQYLSRCLQSQIFIEAVRRTLGIHAQVMSAAELSIAARVDGLSPQDVQSALWRERTLVKTWVMRQTLHLIPTTDFPIYIAARRLTDINWPSIFERSGIKRALFDAYLSAASEILNSGPLTRQQFVEAVGERLKSPELHDLLAKGSWGIAFKPLAWLAFWLINIGIGLVIVDAITSRSALLLLGRLAELGGVLAFVIGSWKRVKAFGK